MDAIMVVVQMLLFAVIALGVVRYPGRWFSPTVQLRSRRCQRPSQTQLLALLLTTSFVLVLLSSCASDPLPDLPKERSPLAATTRTVEHAMGKMQVPQQPQRVVTVDTAALDAALAVNIKPVGSVIYEQWPAYLKKQTADIKSVGDGNQPNLEAILALKPDLILGNKTSSESQYKHFDRIAPTVFVERSGRDGDWKENFRLYANALNKKTEAKQALEQYNQKVAQLKSQLPNPGQVVVSVVATQQGTVGVYSANSFAGSILNDLGVARPEAQAQAQRHAAIISREDLASLDGDMIFLVRDQRSDSSLDRQGFVSDPLWSQLKAVQNDAVYEVNNQVWSAGRNVLAAQQVLEDINDALAASR